MESKELTEDREAVAQILIDASSNYEREKEDYINSQKIENPDRQIFEITEIYNRYARETADSILNLKWEDGSRMIGVLSKDQKLPEYYPDNRPRAKAFRDMLLAGFRKIVDK